LTLPPTRITDAESEVLAALWRRGPMSFAALIEAVKEAQPWGDATIKTLLHRLIQKSAVRSARQDGRQLYHPLLDRRAYIRGEIQALADRLFAGDRAALLSAVEDEPAP
jgi:BlaI family penicillinase repressor